MDRTLHPITVTRRLRACLLLPLLLILAQHGAWLHDLSHAVYAAHPHQVTFAQAHGPLENGVCPSCQSFGQLGSALASPLTAFIARNTPLRAQTEPQYASPAARCPAPRNRGPPRLI